MLPVDREALYLEKGALHATSILPASAAAPLLVSSALLSHSNISNSHIHNAHSVVTSLLTVKEQAEFLADVVIDGSVTVHGTVIGSGPYVDSSDARFKRNITAVLGALDTVNKLRGVRCIRRSIFMLHSNFFSWALQGIWNNDNICLFGAILLFANFHCVCLCVCVLK